MVVDAGYEERYWYPDDGGQVWVAGYQLVDSASGRYLARDAPELAARGLRVVGVAGAGRHHADALDSDAVAPGSPLELRRDPGNEHDPGGARESAPAHPAAARPGHQQRADGRRGGERGEMLGREVAHRLAG